MEAGWLRWQPEVLKSDLPSLPDCSQPRFQKNIKMARKKSNQQPPAHAGPVPVDDGLVDDTNPRVLVAERNAVYEERDEALRRAKQIETDFEKLKKELDSLGNWSQSTTPDGRRTAPFRCGADLFSCAASPSCDKGD